MGDEAKVCPSCAETIRAQAVVCRFCKTDLRTGQPTAAPAPAPAKSGGLPIILIVVLCIVPVIAVIAVIAAIAIPGLLQAQRASNERNASTSLKTLASAQYDFRSNDRDGNKVMDFWTGDVAGLYCLENPDATRHPGPIKLIELSVAAADSNPLRAPAGPYTSVIGDYAMQAPKAGYWFWAMESDQGTNPPTPYRQDTKGKNPVGTAHYNNSRFGFVTYPESFSAGKKAYMLNEANTIYHHQLDRVVLPSPSVPPGPLTDPMLTSWPPDEDMKLYWSPY